MEYNHTIRPIAHIKTDFPEKFGIPRQSGLVKTLKGKIVFEPEFRNPDALREIETFSHLWLIWDFSLAHTNEFKATVRPPRLGGNTHVGVFASRSPFRPNSLGLSCVKLESIESDKELGNILLVSGADMVDNTPIFDIKPYLPLSDCITDAVGGFSDQSQYYSLNVIFPTELKNKIPKEKQESIILILQQDPRPAYHNDEKRTYTMSFAGYEISFIVNGATLKVSDVQETK